MSVNKFEDLVVWIKSKNLTLLIYKRLKDNKDYGFRDQIRRASVSIMNNIAEGFGRKGRREFIQYLSIAHASCAEVKSMLYLGKELEYFSVKDFDFLMNLAEEISKMLTSFIKKLRTDN